MGNPAYNASKTGAVGLTRTLGEAWAEDGIRVNGIAPGLVDTKMTKVTTANPKRLEGALERIPLKRLGTPADMAGAALFLASPLSSYVVGQTIIVDGGLICKRKSCKCDRSFCANRSVSRSCSNGEELERVSSVTLL